MAKLYATEVAQFVVDGAVGQPSPWVTLYALRVLNWWDEHNQGAA